MDFFTSPLLNGRPWWNTAFVNSAGIYFADGTQAAPSISFINEAALGLYRRGAGQLGIAAGGACSTFFSSTGQTWPSTTGSFSFNGIGVVATEALNLSNGNNAALGAQQGAPYLRLGGFGWGTTAGTSQAVDWRLRSLPIQSTVPGAQLLFEFSVAGGAYATFLSIDSSPNGNVVLSPTGTGNFLIGTSTNSANGMIQLAVHTTPAGGIGFGTDGSLYRISASTKNLHNSASSINVLYLTNNVTSAGSIGLRLEQNSAVSYIGNASNGATILVSNNTTALTLTAAQAAEFATTIKTAAPTVGLAGVWKLGVYTAGAIATGGSVRVNVGGTDYDLLTA